MSTDAVLWNHFLAILAETAEGMEDEFEPFEGTEDADFIPPYFRPKQADKPSPGSCLCELVFKGQVYGVATVVAEPATMPLRGYHLAVESFHLKKQIDGEGLAIAIMDMDEAMDYAHRRAYGPENGDGLG